MYRYYHAQKLKSHNHDKKKMNQSEVHVSVPMESEPLQDQNLCVD